MGEQRFQGRPRQSRATLDQQVETAVYRSTTVSTLLDSFKSREEALLAIRMRAHNRLERKKWLASLLRPSCCRVCGESTASRLRFWPAFYAQQEGEGVTLSLLIAKLTGDPHTPEKIAEDVQQFIAYCLTCRPMHGSKENKRHSKATAGRLRWYRSLHSADVCTLCGKGPDRMVALYHLNPSTYVAPISHAARTMNDKQFAEEVAKCVPLCYRCYLNIVKRGLIVVEALAFPELLRPSR